MVSGMAKAKEAKKEPAKNQKSGLKNAEDVLKPQATSEGATIVKVPAYPIDARMIQEEGKPGLPCEVVHIEPIGIIFHSSGHLYRAGQEYICDFKLPVLKHLIHEPVKIIKTVESADTIKKKALALTVEAHFLHRTGEFLNHLQNFLNQLKRKR